MEQGRHANQVSNQLSWGNNIHHKHKAHFRILTININGLPQLRSHPKYGTIREQVIKCQVDILGMSEINLRWNKFSTYDRLSQRTSKWWENTHCQYAYNSHDASTAKFQPGGTALISRNHLSNRAQPSRVHDSTGLGRWVSTLYQGQNQQTLRVIQLYRPCKPNPNSSNGVYQQHSRFFLLKNNPTCPRTQILLDLQAFISQCQMNHEQLIVMGDFNEDITHQSITSFFSDLGMHNILATLFTDQYPPPIHTHQRGTSIIDGIFASHGINATQGGFLEEHIFDTDHKPVWADISMSSIFGTETPPLLPHNRRRLKNEDPRIVNKFNTTYHKLLERHHLPSAISQLTSSYTSSLNPVQQIEYERIDKLRVQCLLQAEKKCRKFKTGNIEFSPTIQHQRNLIRFWKLILKRQQGHRIDTKYLTRWERKLHLQHTFSTPLSTIKSNIKEAYSKYQTLKKEHSTLRDEWIEQLAAAKAEAGNLNSVSVLHNLRQKEKMRRAHRQIRWCLHHDTLTAPITEVTAISNNTTTRHTTKFTVEQAILKANNNKYRQTNDTPPMTTLLPILGHFGISPASQQILQGTFSMPGHLDIYTKKLLTELAIPPHMRSTPPINTHFNTKDYIDGWSKMNERTTSGISKIHFGHHLACAKHDHNASFEAQMCAIPYRTGYSPKRYQASINAMLLKKAGKTDVDSLRTIVLLEPDFNFMNKKLGRDVMNYAEQHHLIAPEQFGSRKHHSSIDQVIIKTLFYDTLRIKRQDGYLCSNDAKSCYDRITHSIASLALQRVGLPTGPILSMFKSLQNMKHYLRTGYGISSSSYGKSLLQGKPPQGSGQGNGASPCIWVMVSTPLLNMMRREGFGAHFITPLTKEKISFVGCSFVDDTDLVLSSFDSEQTLDDITPLMQSAINTWEGGLRATGGALVPEKSWVYPIKYSWNAKGDPQLTPTQELDINFTVKNSAQEIKQLQLVSPHSAKETLGVFLSPNGSHSTQIEYLKTKTTTWANKIRTHNISPHNALLSLHTTIMSTLKYPAPALSLTRHDWHQITKPILQSGLQAAGICSKFPKPLRHGTTKNLGLHIPCMYLTQGILKIMKYMSFISSPSILGQMLRLCEQNIKLELGLSGNLYTTPYATTHFLTTTSWIKQLWKFTSEHNILLQDHSPNLKPATNTDKTLMEIFLDNSFKPWELRAINKCRKYLKVITVGDIITGNGLYISPNISKGKRSSSITSTMHWPNQADPGPQAWSIWRRALKKLLNQTHSILPSLQPTQWITSDQRRYNWFYNRGLDRLLQRSNNDKWNFYTKIRHRGRQRRQPLYHYRGTLNSLPHGSTVASITHMNINIVRFTGSLPSPTTPNPLPTPINTFHAYKRSLVPNERHSILDISDLQHLPHIIDNIKQGNCALVCDGSFFPSTAHAAAAFVLGNEAVHRRIIGRCFVVGPPSSYSSYRSELAGIHAGLTVLLGICSSQKITSGRIVLACDNKGALQRIASGKTKPQHKNFDYLSAIQNIISELTITISISHVEGHKDEKMPFDKLTTLESMNVIADSHAKAKASTTPSKQFQTNATIYKEWSPLKFRLRDDSTIRIHSCLDTTLYELLTVSNSRNYWVKKLKIPQVLEETINWGSLSTAFLNIPSAKKKDVLKWSSGFCGTNETLFRRKQASSAECPGCQHPRETTDHVIKCPAAAATKVWDEAISKLKTWMLARNAAPELTEAILLGLQAWRNNHPALHHRYSLPHLTTAVNNQNQIGWSAFLKGFTANEWEYAQHNYLQFKASRMSGKRWIAALIRKLWETIWALWRYRNGLVHMETNTPLRKLTALLNITLLKELQYGLDGLPSQYAYLFKSKMSQVLTTSINQKKQWILTVWVARDTLTPQHISTQNRHPIITSILTAWKHRIKQYDESHNQRQTTG